MHPAASVSPIRLEANCSAFEFRATNATASATGSGVPASTSVYIGAVIALSSTNVLLNAVCLRVLPALLPRRSPTYQLLVGLSLAEILFNASALCLQPLVYVYGYRQQTFASAGWGVAVCAAMQMAQLAHQTLHRFRNWTVVLVAWRRFGRLIVGGGSGSGGAGRWSNWLGQLACNFALSLAASLPKLFEHNALVCLDSLRLGQERTWLADSPAYRYGYGYGLSYLTSTWGPVVALVGLHGFLLRALLQARRRQGQKRDNDGDLQDEVNDDENGDANFVAADSKSGDSNQIRRQQQLGDLLIATLTVAFCLCELPAFFAALVHFNSPGGSAAHHLVHVAHLGTALDSTLNLFVYLLPYRRMAALCRRRFAAAAEKRRAREREHIAMRRHRRRRRRRRQRLHQNRQQNCHQHEKEDETTKKTVTREKRRRWRRRQNPGTTAQSLSDIDVDAAAAAADAYSASASDFDSNDFDAVGGGGSDFSDNYSPTRGFTTVGKSDHVDQSRPSL